MAYKKVQNRLQMMQVVNGTCHMLPIDRVIMTYFYLSTVPRISVYQQIRRNFKTNHVSCGCSCRRTVAVA